MIRALLLKAQRTTTPTPQHLGFVTTLEKMTKFPLVIERITMGYNANFIKQKPSDNT
jgi:hypothetical protein